jgi:beta-glucosidase-like glycosyl hydrolase
MTRRLGQLVLAEVGKAHWNSAFERLLQSSEPAGVFFRDLPTLPATWEVARKCVRTLHSVPFLAIQDEGEGALCGLFGASLASEWLIDLRDEAIEGLGDLVGRGMHLAGLNLNFAPTVDLPLGLSSPADVTVGDPHLAVTRRAEAFVRGLSRHGVLPCAGHFPGLSIGASERLRSSPVVGRSMATLWREDLVPYRTLGSQLPVIQISHAAYKAYDYEFPRPASLSSRVVEGLLRVKLAYGGVALADVSAAARWTGVDLGEAAVRALEAGCDLLVVPAEQKPLETVLTALERASELGKLPRERVEQAGAHVQNAKQGLAPPSGEPSERDVSRLAHDFEKFRKRYE